MSSPSKALTADAPVFVPNTAPPSNVARPSSDPSKDLEALESRLCECCAKKKMAGPFWDDWQSTAKATAAHEVAYFAPNRKQSNHAKHFSTKVLQVTPSSSDTKLAIGTGETLIEARLSACVKAIQFVTSKQDHIMAGGPPFHQPPLPHQQHRPAL